MLVMLWLSITSKHYCHCVCDLAFARNETWELPWCLHFETLAVLGRSAMYPEQIKTPNTKVTTVRGLFTDGCLTWSTLSWSQLDAVDELQSKVETAEKQMYNLQQDKSSLVAELSELGDRSQAVESQLHQCLYELQDLQQQKANPPHQTYSQHKPVKVNGKLEEIPRNFPPHVQQLDSRKSEDEILKQLQEEKNSYSLARDKLVSHRNVEEGQSDVKTNTNDPDPLEQEDSYKSVQEKMNIEEDEQQEKDSDDGAAANGQDRDQGGDMELDRDEDAIGDPDEDEEILQKDDDHNSEDHKQGQEDGDDYRDDKVDIDDDKVNANDDIIEDEKQQGAPQTPEVKRDAIKQNSRIRGDM